MTIDEAAAEIAYILTRNEKYLASGRGNRKRSSSYERGLHGDVRGKVAGVLDERAAMRTKNETLMHVLQNKPGRRGTTR